MEAQFSVYYQIAAAWLYGSDQGWAIYDHLDDPAVHDLCDKVMVESEELSSMIETGVAATWQDGTKEELWLITPLWEGERQPSYEGVKSKVQSVASGVLGAQRTEEIADWIKTADKSSMAELYRLLA